MTVVKPGSLGLWKGREVDASFFEYLEHERGATDRNRWHGLENAKRVTGIVS
jgi:hypothetical protein